MPPVTATVTFSAEDSTELGLILAAVGAALQAVGRDAATAGVGIPIALDSPAAPGSAADWYAANGAKFAARLKPNARQALLLIVSEGPIVPFDQIRQALGMHGPKLAGTLASVGAAVRALGAPEAPFRADHKRQVYTIEPAVQSALRPHLE